MGHHQAWCSVEQPTLKAPHFCWEHQGASSSPLEPSWAWFNCTWQKPILRVPQIPQRSPPEALSSFLLVLGHHEVLPRDTQRCQFPQLGVNVGGLVAEQLCLEGNTHAFCVPGTFGSESLARPSRASWV